MNSAFSIVQSLNELFAGKLQKFLSDIDNVHGVWLTEIQQEADRMLASDLSAEPELMPKTPSQKKSNRKKRISLGFQEESSAKRRFSKGSRSKLRGSSVKSSDLTAEDVGIPKASTSGQDVVQPKRSTRRNKQSQPEVSLEAASPSDAAGIPKASTSGQDVVQPKRSTRRNKKAQSEVSLEAASASVCSAEQVPEEEPEVVDMEQETAVPNTPIKIGTDEPQACFSNTTPLPPKTPAPNTGIQMCTDEPQACFSNTTPSPPKMPAMEVSVRISSPERRSAELAAEVEASPGRHATKIAIAGTPTGAERSSVRHFLKLRYSKAGLRHSMTQDAVRRASRRSILKKRSTRAENSMCSSNNVSVDSSMEAEGEMDNRELLSVHSDDGETAVEEAKAIEETGEQKLVDCNVPIARSQDVNSTLPKFPLDLTTKVRDDSSGNSSGSPTKASVGQRRSSSVKRKSPDIQDSPAKKLSPPKKSKSAVRPSVKSFLHSVQKNHMLIKTPKSVGGSTVKSFIKYPVPLKIDPKSKELLKALKNKQEQEEERMKKMEEEKKRKQEEQKRKRDERLRKVVEARMKEDEGKKMRIQRKMSQKDGKNDKVGVAEEKAKKKNAVKRQEEVDHKRRLEEEARLQDIQRDEEKQELEAKQAAEEEECRRKLAKACRDLELRREREREKQAVVEREHAARERERRRLEEERRLDERKRLMEEQQQLAAEEAAREREAAKQKMAAASAALNIAQYCIPQSPFFNTPVKSSAALNVTVVVEESPQSYSLTPKSGNKTHIKSTNAEDYGMDQNSDDSTDDESAPRKPIPSWAEGPHLQQLTMEQYYNPPDLHSYFGTIEPPSLENIFYKSKPRYFKRTSSAVWHSPPRLGHY